MFAETLITRKGWREGVWGGVGWAGVEEGDGRRRRAREMDDYPKSSVLN